MTVRYVKTGFNFLVVVGILCVVLMVFGQAPKFTLTVHTGRGANGYDVNSTMISPSQLQTPRRNNTDILPDLALFA